MDYFFEDMLKKIRDVIIGALCLIAGIYMIATNNYNEVAIVIISIIAFVYAIFHEKL